MNHGERLVVGFRHGVIAIGAVGIIAAASPAAAQWTRVTELPASDVFTVITKGDTIVAGVNALVHVSVNGGASWLAPSQPTTGVSLVASVQVRNGKLYAGTSGKGVFISDDLGQTWRGFNEGLVGGIFNTQLDISDMANRGDSLYAGTFGAGVYVRKLTGVSAWSHFGEEFEPNQASNISALAVGGPRVLAMGGANGTVFFRDPGDPEWTQSFLNNVGLHPGFSASSAIWTGTGWVVGAGVARGVFLSTQGQEPWTFVNVNLGTLDRSAFATRGHRVFAAFNPVNVSLIEQSSDDGATWEVLDVQPGVFVYRMAMVGAVLYAGRNDGLWRRSTSTVSVPVAGGHHGLGFAVAGRQPVMDLVRFSFDLPEAGDASIEVFDLAGRRAAIPARQSLSAGPHEISWNARALSPGVYAARLTSNGMQEVVRLVRVP